MMSSSIYKKGLVVGIIFLFVGMSAFPSTGISNIEKTTHIQSDGNTLYVGGSGLGNFSTIQDAINNSSDGYTIFVYDDSSPYIGQLIVNRSISLIGENKNTTVIDGDGGGSVILVNADYVNISGFTVQNSENAGINAWSNYSKIIGNIFKNNGWCGYYLKIKGEKYSHDNIFSNNYIENNGGGIHLDRKQSKGVGPDNNTISDNIIVSNGYGITLMHCWGSKVIGNSIQKNDDQGINLYLGTENIIMDNIITNNDKGIWVFDTKNNIVSMNNIYDNSGVGIDVIGSSNNNISNNNISDNYKGISFDDSHNNKFNKNSLSSNKIGLYMDGFSAENIITNNLLYNNGFFSLSGGKNTYINNLVNNKPFIILERVSNRIIENAGQVVLKFCDSITIKNLDLSDSTVGIELLHSDNCVIEGNNIQNNNLCGVYMLHSDSNYISGNYITNNNDYGIYCVGSSNSIIRNLINKNSIGVYWEGISNIVEENNFILNNRYISFYLYHNGENTVRMNNNYWDRARILPKIFFGRREFKIFEMYIPLPWIGLDLNPASIPYEI